MIRHRHRHTTTLSLLLLYASAHDYPSASAFSRCSGRFGGTLSGLRSSTPTNQEAVASPSSTGDHRIDVDEDCLHNGDIRECLLHWIISPIIIASTITLSPLPSLASDQQFYSALAPDRGDSWSSSSVAIATGEISSTTPSPITELGLKPPTEDKPQIMLTGKAADRQSSQQGMMPRKSNGREPILQGLVFFPERAPTDPAAKMPSGPQVTQQLDYYSDILVLTAVSAAKPEGPVLAGAKFPVSSVRFPFSFQMYKENLLTSRPGVQDAWDDISNTGDVILRANICPSDASTFPCEVKETKKYAEGVAKLITNLPGLADGQSVRAPASLALQ